MEEKKTSNSNGQIVSGSKVKLDNIIYDVGQIRGNMLMLYRGGKFEATAMIDEVEVL